jgi:hypothetical protein
MPEQACGQRIADLTARLDGLRAHRDELAAHQEHPPEPSASTRQGQSIVR